MGHQLINEGEEKLNCAKCGSTKVFVDKKGFSGLKACSGTLFVGPLGLLCGTHKSNQIQQTCLKCKYKW